MTDRTKPGVAFWATVVVVAGLVAYPLSFGPACWVSSRFDVGHKLVPVMYRPLTAAIRIKDFPRLLYYAINIRDGSGVRMQPARRGFNPVNWYAEAWSADHWHWCYNVDYCMGSNEVKQYWVWTNERVFD